MFIHGAGRTPASWGPQLARFEGALAVALPGPPDGAPLHGTAAMADWVIAEMEGVPGVRFGHSTNIDVWPRQGPEGQWNIQFSRSGQAFLLLPLPVPR